MTKGPRPRPAAPTTPDAGDGNGPTVRTPVPARPGAPVETGPTTPVARSATGAGDTTVVVPVPPRTPAAGGGGDGSWFRPWDSEATQVIPVAAKAAPAAPADQDGPTQVRGGDSPTERILLPGATSTLPGVPPTPPGDGDAAASAKPPRRRRRTLLLVAGAVVGVLALLYVGDLLLSSGSVPRGVTVAGVEIGGLRLADAEQRLRTEIEPRTTQPVAVTAGEVTTEIDPTVAGLAVDWEGTLDRAGAQPLNPITRITSLFTQREIGVATTSDDVAVATALEQLLPVVDRAPVEGTVRFEGITPVAVDPVAGQHLDLPAAGEVLRRDWALGAPVALPLVEVPALTSPEDVADAIADVARPAVSGPVTVIGEADTEGTLTPQVIASALTFTADPAGTLVPELNPAVITEALAPALAASERPSADAELDFSTGTAVVVPSVDGRGVDYEATLRDLLPVLTGSGEREVTAVYADQPAELTTEELNALGITGVIGEFTTGGFASDSGRNIRRAAEQINGIVVQPGETFSLNDATVPRNAANGYVEAGIINEGRASRGIGGGVSQVATTLYNAAYFAGMVDVHHQEHSFYISRYPAGREATVFEGAIDLQFRNDNPTGVLIETVWTPSSITVRLYGTKRYEVTSTPGERTNPTTPNTVTIPAGEQCSPSQGAPGFTITDTRTLTEISTGQVRQETRTVRYNPSPTVVCGT